MEQGDEEFVSFCPELGVASQGATIEEATANLKDAIDILLESASLDDLKHILTKDIAPLLDEWGVIARKDEIEKSRQKIMQAIVEATLTETQSPNGNNAKNEFSPLALNYDYELANAPA